MGEVAPVCARASKIHGLGLFATRDIPPGTRLTYYDGELLSRDEAVRRDAQGKGGWLCSTIAREVVIDGLRKPLAGRGWASLANHGRPTARLVRTPDKVWLESTKPIRRGEEVLLNYGPGFWRRHERSLVPTPPPIHDIAINGKRTSAIVTPVTPRARVHGCALRKGPCRGAWYVAKFEEGKLWYADTGTFERATIERGVLKVRNGNAYERVPSTKLADGTHRVLWTEELPAELGCEYQCVGPCALRGVAFVYVRIAARRPILVEIRPVEHLTLSKGACFVVPRMKRPLAQARPFVCGEVRKTGLGRHVYN